jgi:E3 ubiquitin-protein ligase HUWE1
MNTATHPLLLDSPSSDSRQGDSSLLRRRQSIANAARQTPEYTAWAQSIEQVIGTGAVEALQELLSSHGLAHLSGPDQIRLQVAPGPNGGIAMVIDSSPAALEAAQATGQAQQAQAQALPRQAGQGRGTGPVSAPRVVRHLTDRINSTTEFLPVTSAQRWQEESRVTQAAASLARLTNHVINVLHAPARVRAKEDKIAEQLRDEAEFKRIEEKKNVLALAVENAEQAERAAASMDVEPVVEGVAAAEPAPMEGVTDDITEVMNLARSLAAGAAAAAPAHPSTSEDERDQEDDEQDDEQDDDDDDEEEEYHDEEDEASGSGDVSTEARVTIFIHGEEVDITDTGIDPTFLEALPDDMREEVLNQHFRESRAAVPPAAVPSQINSEFLDALPPDLRAEVLRQEAAEQRREQASARGARAAADGPAAGDPPAGPSGVDPADFLATLAPGLRQAVEQEEVLLGNAQPGVDGTGLRLGGARIPAAAAIAPAPKKPAHREAIQLLDKSGLATLVRLLFFPQPLRKNALQKVLVNLCENSRTRMELINLLLAILQDGTRDVSAVDKSFSQMSLRANKALEFKDTPRRKVAPETPGASAGAGGALPHFPGESVPNLIAHRCLEALMFLVSSNDQAPLFFLTEQETVVGLNRRSSKKGKGKEKAVPSTTYPIIVLLGLLDRPALLKTQAMMDSLTQLLSAITKALVILQKKPAEVGGDAAVVPVVPAPAVALETSSTVAAEPAAEGEGSSSAAAATTAPDASPSDVLLKDPPQIAPSVLRLVVNVLDAGECSSKTFQHTLVLIQNLSFLPEARETISDELKVRSEALSALLLPDLAELLVAIQSAEDVRGVTLAKFSPASSLQAKLLRILKTIDWIHSPPKKASTDLAADPTKLSDAEAKVSAIYESFSFVGLWQGLGSCLEGIEKKPELLYIATVLLPLIESLMVVSKYVGVQKAGDVSSPPPMSPSLGPPSTPMESMFLTFTDEHRKILNTMVRNNPALMSGSFAILVHNPKVLEFDNKRSYFFSVSFSVSFPFASLIPSL